MAAEQGVSPAGKAPRARGLSGRKALILLLVICIAPVIASYTAYYFMPPDGRVNYGTLVEQRDVRPVWTVPLASTLPDGEQERLALDTPMAPRPAAPDDAAAGADATPGVRLGDWRGRWLMIVVAPGNCADLCPEYLYDTRQVRLTTGKDRDRVQRLWLVTDGTDPDPAVLAEHRGLVAARVDPALLSTFFKPADGQSISDHIYLVDPIGNLMMRYPVRPDPNRMKKDLTRLLKASRIG